MINFKDTTTIILCGGFGTRLRSVVNDKPKVLAPINGKAFIDILINRLASFGIENFVLCVGYLKEMMFDHFKHSTNIKDKVHIQFSVENEPLGTGGAVKQALKNIDSDNVIVMNGDSFCDVDYNNFMEFHVLKNADISMVLTKSDSPGDYGSIVLDDNSEIISFSEKTKSNQSALINAGIYLMSEAVLSKMSDQKVFSIEYDFFPKLVSNNFYGFITNNELLDIGTPQRYQLAIEKLS